MMKNNISMIAFNYVKKKKDKIKKVLLFFLWERGEKRQDFQGKVRD